MQNANASPQSFRFTSIVLSLLCVLTFVFSFNQNLNAQILYGTLTGNVTDSGNAVLPGVTIELKSLDTGTVKTVVTDDAGGYTLTNLNPGSYTVRITKSGFKTAVNEMVTIVANNTTRFNSKLEVGDVNATVVVSDDTIAVLQTDRTDVNTQLQAKQIEDLPMTSSAGRNFQALYKTIPGFNLVTEGVSSDGGNPQRTMTSNVNGNSFQANSTQIDGASNSYIWLPFNTAYVPPAESIQSVSVVTNSYDAEQGNANGASTNVVTKSGTNEFHGSAFWFHTDNGLKARHRFQVPTQGNPKFNMNQYGYAVGGPILKNKLFFFTDWEGTKRVQRGSRTGQVVNPAGIFDSAGNANLSAAIPAGTDCNVTRVAGCIYDPNTGNADGTGRLAFAGNIIPAARINPAIKTMLARIRSDGYLNGAGVTATNNYQTAGALSLDRNTFDVKINYLPTEKMMIFGRYSISNAMYIDPPFLGDAMGGASGGGQVGAAPSRIQSVGLGGTYAFSATKLMDVNIGYTRQNLGAEYAPDIDLGQFGVDVLHIPGTNGDSRLAGGTPAFQFTQGGWNGIGNVDTGNPFNFRDNQYVANGNFTWIQGSHDIRFGIGYSHNGMNHFQPQGGAFQTPRGSFRFTGGITALNGGPTANKANSLADFLLGLPFEVGKAVQNAIPNSLRWQTWSAYVRDRWQINPNLTVNLGVRWEHYPFATTDHGGVKLYDPSTGNVLIGGNGSTPLDDGVDVGFGKFLPRVGIAYKWGPKTVIRGGWAMSADNNNWRFFRNNYPATTNSLLQGSTAFRPGATLTPVTLAPYPGLQVGIPFVPVPDISSGVIPLPSGVNPGNVIPFDFNRGYTHSYNLTLQREFWGFVGEAAYVGNRGINLLTNENINAGTVGLNNNGRPLFIQYGRNVGDVNCLCPDAESYYDSLQTKLTRRLGSNGYVGFVYTFSKAINSQDNEEVAGTFGGQGGFLLWPNPAYKSRNKALATFDRTHNFTAYGAYELPFGKGQKWVNDGWLSYIIGGWQVNWVLQSMSGNMMTMIGGGGNLQAPGNSQTADQIGPIRILNGIGPLPGQAACAPSDMSCHYFDPTSFRAVPGAEVRFGTSGRNILRGPGFFNLDGSLFRTFTITERIKFQVRMEVFGLTNTPHFANPGTDVNNTATFGVITGTVNAAGRGSGTGGERQFWFAGKLSF